MYQIVFYRSRRGDSPIDAFLDDLDGKTQSKTQAYIGLLERNGPNLKRPHADHVRGKIRELRIPFGHNQYRILYFFYDKAQIVLVHAFFKKSWQLREKDIRLAEWRIQDWMRRQP